MTYYVHETPGRLRVKDGALQGQADRCAQLEQLLCRLDGVKTASVRSHTGSIVVTFDPDVVAAGDVLRGIEALGHYCPTRHRPIDDYHMETAFRAGTRLGRAALGWTMKAAFQGATASLGVVI